MISVTCKGCNESTQLTESRVCPECHALYCATCEDQSGGMCPSCGAPLQYLQ